MVTNPGLGNNCIVYSRYYIVMLGGSPTPLHNVHCIVHWLSSLTNPSLSPSLPPPPLVMPSKAALFNSKCDMIHDFGITHRNTALYNPHGNNILNNYVFIML